MIQSRPVELDELPDDFVLPQHLRHGQHQIRRRRTFGQFPRQFETDHFRRQHVDRLTEHDRLGLDSADPPTDDPQSVDHRCMTVCSHKAVRKHRPVLS